MNQLFDLKLSKIEIENLGRTLGADVIPCFYNRAVMAEGMGDIVTPVHTRFKYYLVIIKPEISYGTKEMYERIDQEKGIKQPENSNQIIQALENNKLELLANNLYNAFEYVIEEKDMIQKIKKELSKQGAIRKHNDWFWILCIWHI